MALGCFLLEGLNVFIHSVLLLITNTDVKGEGYMTSLILHPSAALTRFTQPHYDFHFFSVS